MPKFIVTRKEVHNQGVEIEAKDEKEAIKLVANGEGEDIPALFEYSHTLDSSLWHVEPPEDKGPDRGCSEDDGEADGKG